MSCWLEGYEEGERCFTLDCLNAEDYYGTTTLLRDIETSLYYVLVPKN